MVETLTAAAATSFAVFCAYGLAAGEVARRFTLARRQRVGAPTVLRFAARDGRATTAASWHPAPAARGAVVLVHGKDACRAEVLKQSTAGLVAAFVGAGISVLTIDLRGHGDSSRARLTYGARERHDVLGAVDWLRAQGHSRVGVLGASLGAAAALLAAAEEPAIAAVVADSAFADFGHMIERQYRKRCRLPGWLLPGALAIARLATGVALDRVRPVAAAAALAGRPCLVIHARGDRFVPADDAEAIACAAGAELWLTDCGRHVGSYAADPERYARRVVGFFAAHLAA